MLFNQNEMPLAIAQAIFEYQRLMQQANPNIVFPMVPQPPVNMQHPQPQPFPCQPRAYGNAQPQYMGPTVDVSVLWRFCVVLAKSISETISPYYSCICFAQPHHFKPNHILIDFRGIFSNDERKLLAGLNHKFGFDIEENENIFAQAVKEFTLRNYPLNSIKFSTTLTAHEKLFDSIQFEIDLSNYIGAINRHLYEDVIKLACDVVCYSVKALRSEVLSKQIDAFIDTTRRGDLSDIVKRDVKMADYSGDYWLKNNHALRFEACSKVIGSPTIAACFHLYKDTEEEHRGFKELVIKRVQELPVDGTIRDDGTFNILLSSSLKLGEYLDVVMLVIKVVEQTAQEHIFIRSGKYRYSGVTNKQKEVKHDS